MESLITPFRVRESARKPARNIVPLSLCKTEFSELPYIASGFSSVCAHFYTVQQVHRVRVTASLLVYSVYIVNLTPDAMLTKVPDVVKISA